jgi:hypothetical protein
MLLGIIGDVHFDIGRQRGVAEFSEIGSNATRHVFVQEPEDLFPEPGRPDRHGGIVHTGGVRRLEQQWNLGGLLACCGRGPRPLRRVIRRLDAEPSNRRERQLRERIVPDCARGRHREPRGIGDPGRNILERRRILGRLVILGRRFLLGRHLIVGRKFLLGRQLIVGRKFLLGR